MAGTQVLKANDWELVFKDNSNLWDQLTTLMRENGWTTQDYATTSLLREMENCLSIFIVRKADNYLIGALTLIETDDHVYGNVYVLRDGYRASGLGMKIIVAFQQILGESLARKPLICRGVSAMMNKYSGPPFYAAHLYEMYSIRLNSRKEFVDFFPGKAPTNYSVLSVKDMTPSQFKKFLEYDKEVTGVNREKFLRGYYNIGYVEGLVLLNAAGEVKGVIGAVPTNGGDHLFKINPIYAENIDDATLLVQSMANKIKDEEAEFIVHCRTQSAGDRLLQKARDEKKPMAFVGVLCCATNLNQNYTDPSKTNLMFAPTNSPAHFDG